jgi:hypothetical protein
MHRFDTSTRTTALPLDLWRLDSFSCCITRLAAVRLTPSARERAPGDFLPRPTFPSMKLPRFNIWSLCLAVAGSALMIKQTLMLGVLQTLFMPVLFLGPLCGIVVDRHQGGTGIAGGIIAGILSGFVLFLIMNIYSFFRQPVRLDRTDGLNDRLRHS